MKSEFNFTSESVSEGHPDKICDQISDAILDAYLKRDPESRVACETLVTTNSVTVAGEVKGPKISENEIDALIRKCVRGIGYEQPGFHWEKLDIRNLIHAQSANIAQGVDTDGAGDQGIMFGYAVDETPELMPAPIHYSHRILRLLAEARKSGKEIRLGPDSKSQLTVRYVDAKPVEVDTIVLSIQHFDENLSSDDVRQIAEPYVREALPDHWLTSSTKWHVNPTGKFVIGGPDGDCGLTGRKIIVDTYGGAAPHGGGAFSGKDPTKVDRSAAYAGRYLAKNIVKAGLARRCSLQLSYAIGVAQPLSIYVDTFGTGEVDNRRIEDKIRELMDLSPRGIRNHFELGRPIYQRTAAYGHFGREPDADGGFSWERTDLADALRSLL